MKEVKGKLSRNSTATDTVTYIPCLKPLIESTKRKSVFIKGKLSRNSTATDTVTYILSKANFLVTHQQQIQLPTFHA